MIPLPPLAEQRRIAEVLDKADALRAKRRAALAQLDTLTQSIFLDMFGDPARGSTKWPTSRLADVDIDFLYGTSNKSGSAGKPTLRIPNVIDGAVNLSELKTVDVSAREFQKLHLIDDDLLFVRTNGNPAYVGRCAIFRCESTRDVGFQGDQFIFASYLIRGRLADDRLLPTYLHAFFSSPAGRRQMRAHSKTSAGQYNLNTKGLTATIVPLPPVHMQREFVDRVRSVEKLRDIENCAALEVDRLFASLQSRAFSGTL